MNPGAVESHFGDLVFNSRFTGLVTISELKYPVTVTTAESIMSFWALPVTVNLNGLATGAMEVNCDHERTLKASIIHLIQLIGCFTPFCIIHIKNRPYVSNRMLTFEYL